MARRVNSLVAVLVAAVLACLVVASGAARQRGRLPAALVEALGGGNGAVVCIGCDVVVFNIQADAVADEKPIEQAVKDFCDKHFHGTWVQTVCDEVIADYGDDIIHLLAQGATPDDVCQFIGLCKNATCRLYKKSEPHADLRSSGAQTPIEIAMAQRAHARKPQRFNPLDYIKEIIEKVFDKHLPLVDLDNDTFSSAETFRGADWRGRDCEDFIPDVYPGRAKTTHLAEVDHNCNGIWGTAPDGQSFEQKFCANTGMRGIAVLGDSASAHFHVPFFNHTSPKDFERMFEDELDWPQCSWNVGHDTTANCPYAYGLPMDSIYLRLWERNHCNHRDYQSIAVNGARSTAMASHVMYALTRNPEEDQPLIVFYSLVGNDVCNPHPGGDHMTQPPEFKEMVSETLTWLDTTLPQGSYVFLIGLEDNSDDWNIMGPRIHPLNVTYYDLWEFTDCLEANPCWGWLNPDPYWRNYTTALAMQLNQVLDTIATTQSYNHFEVHYLGNFFKSNLDKWVAGGGAPQDMYEIVGGGHPSQVAQVMNAEAIWNAISAKAPDALGPINPNNALIEQMFGDQQGY